MSGKEQSIHHEIIVIRRSEDEHHEEHSGGVWKIAHADFMTALMAFFLVMWLINSITDEQRKAVANYFNPIKLVDLQDKPRGLDNDMLTEGRDNKTQKDDSEESIVILNGDDRNKIKEKLFHDPFSLDYWEHDAPFDVSCVYESESVKDTKKNMLSTTPNLPKTSVSKTEGISLSVDSEKKATIINEIKQQIVSHTQKYKEIFNDIMADIADLIEEDTGEEKPSLHVIAEENGVKIELTDKQDYGMFSVGSARPNPRFVSLLEKIAQILKKHPGMVVVSGHTDARPYKNKTRYDNWQLSVARAQVAYSVLVQAGLSEERFFRVEGYADRDLKNLQNAYADENRRIAIFLLLREGK